MQLFCGKKRTQNTFRKFVIESTIKGALQKPTQTLVKSHPKLIKQRTTIKDLKHPSLTYKSTIIQNFKHQYLNIINIETPFIRLGDMLQMFRGYV